MPANPNSRLCSHIKVNGVRCGSPSLRGEVFCYFHQRMIRGVRTPPRSRLHPIANFEDAESIQASLMEVVNALIRNQIDVPRARLILRALSIAVHNSAKTHFDCHEDRMVKDVPEYPAAPPAPSQFSDATAQAAALTSIASPRPEESEADRLASAFQPAPTPARARRHGNPRRKPPAAVQGSAKSRATSPGRAG